QIALDGKVGEARGSIRICFPFILLEPILPRLSAQHWFAREARLASEEETGRMAGRLQSVTVPVSVELGAMEITLDEVVALQAGDLLLLDRRKGEQHNVYVNGRLKFRGKVGVLAQKRLAVQIT